MSLFGEKKSEQTIPAYIEDAQKAALSLAQNRNALGYIPKYGPEIAAFTGQQMAAMNGANQMAGSLGLQTAPMNIPTAKNYGNGITGYSSQDLYQSNMEELKAANPELYAAIAALVGKGSGQTGGMPGVDANGNPIQGGNVHENPFGGGTQSSGNPSNSGGLNSSLNGAFGGEYGSMRDRFDGGGPGKSSGSLGGRIGGGLGGLFD